MGFLAGSVFGKALEGSLKTLGKKYMSDTLRQKLIEAALKSILKGTLKDPGKYFKNFKSKQFEDGGKKYVQEMLKKELTSQVLQDYLESGLRVGGFDGASVELLKRLNNYEAIKKVVQKNYADPIANFLGDSLSLYNVGIDALTNREVLGIIRQRIIYSQQMTSEAEKGLDEANEEVGRARDARNYCTQGEGYQRYLRYLEFLKLPKQG